MVPAVGPMNEYWNQPGTKRITIELIQNIFTPFGRSICSAGPEKIWFFVPFALLGIYFLIRSKNKIAYATALSFILLFFAVLIGKWPVVNRLWLFLPAMVLLFFPSGFDFIAKRYKKLAGIGFWGLTAIIIYQLTMTSWCELNLGKNMYMLAMQEANPLIAYVRENIREGEKLYVYPQAVPTFRFKNGYNTAKIGNVAADNIIYGKERTEWNEEKLGNELLSILENDKGVYLIFQHYHTGIEAGLNVLLKYGELTEIMNAYRTPLLYFQKTAQNQSPDNGM
jgi:hypothetical protein